MPNDTRTTARILADHLLPDGGLPEFVLSRRAAGMSWRRIELDLMAATEGLVNVTSQTLRVWFTDQSEAAAS